jgi:polyketide biosynthesis enoyl-CoA hydratase PksH
MTDTDTNTYTYATLSIRTAPRIMTVTLNRPEQDNSINGQMLVEFGMALDAAERDPDCRFFVLEGQPGVFCTGMDFAEVAGDMKGGEDRSKAEAYMGLLRRLSSTPKVTVAQVDGRTSAGGVGLVAACDIAMATQGSLFSLSEALWGLLPACVVPYLIRRIGFQKAFLMTLSTQPIPAVEALACNLVDEIVTDPDDALRRRLLRIGRLDEQTIGNLKAYFRRMWIVTEAMEQEAISEITRLVSSERVRENIRGFVTDQRFPWSQE